MAEKETIFATKIKYDGIFSFKDFYKFCYDYITDEQGYDLAESKYIEKLNGNAKDMKVFWSATKEVTDYFKFEFSILFRILNLKKVEVNKNGTKVNTNKGSVEIKMKGNLLRDYKGKFEINAFQKFLRSIYEKWVIASRVEEYEAKLVEECSEFLTQAKAYLDLEGK